MNLSKTDITNPPTFADADIQGHLDAVHAGCATGWISSSAHPGLTLEVEVLADDAVVAREMADSFRPDLEAAGIGNGNHAFRIVLPFELCDGQSRQLVVRHAQTGKVLDGSPLEYVTTPAVLGDVALDGSSLVGWAEFSRPLTNPSQVDIIENGEVIARAPLTFAAAKPLMGHFRIPLPTGVFDGRPHLFMLETEGGKCRLGQYATVTPTSLTSDATLQRYAREGLTPSLSTLAGHRYEALAAALGHLVQAEPSSTQPHALRQLLQVHDRLVKGASDSDKQFESLVFPEHAAPRVSIVIPAHNKFPVTYHCLSSLLLAGNKATFEVIVVDDGSKDETTDIPNLVKGIKYVRNDEAQGFIRACNLGGEQAVGEYIVMLNNDTEVTRHWLDELLWTFEHFDGVGMVGAKLIYPNGRLQEAGGIVWNTGDPWNYGRNANPHDPRFNYARQTDYLSGACVMLPLELWRGIGGFSKEYIPAYFEDTDLAFQVRDRGYKTVYAPFAEVIHFEGVSNGTDIASGIKVYQEINRPKFKRRWVEACRGNGKVGEGLELNKDRNVEFRALVLDAETPMPDKDAGSFAAIQEMRMLQALGFKCTFMPQNLAWMGHYTRNLQRMGVEVQYPPFVNSFSELLQSRGHEFDIVYVTRFYVAQQCIEDIRTYAPRAKIILNNADLHFLREIRAALQTSDRESIKRATDTRDAELGVMRGVDLVLSYTSVEKAVIESHNLSSTKVARCPWITEVSDAVPGFRTRTDISFLGGFRHSPNIEAMQWFITEVMPLLSERLPDVKLRIYGSHPPALLDTLAAETKNVVLEGWVPDVGTAYDNCRVFIAPLQSGAGIKGKVIGALAHGVPTVMSPIAAEGIPVAPGEEAMIAATPAEWVDAIATLYENEKRWQSMSSRSLAFAKSNYGFEQGMRLMQQALEQVGFFGTFPNKALVAK